MGLRDTEAPERAPFVVSASVRDAFVDGAKKGEFGFQLSRGSRFATPVVVLGCAAEWWEARGDLVGWDRA
ncbi:hypothetical protein [Streptosporangium sp. NPDC049046]|uniref:hypothetical protein n=1 Tax=Streptosporangium sp. NPDC049046 TaxID=3155031 RepID=UPI003435DDA5